MNDQAGKNWEALRRLRGRKRLEHIWTYYKLPIVLMLVLVYMAGYAVYRHITQKEDVLYLALVNFAPGSELTWQLTEGFAEEQGLTEKQRVYLYSDLLLSEKEGADQEYVYASEMRIMAAIAARKMDVVLMNAEARDAFAAQGYLVELSELDPDFSGQWMEISDTRLIREAGFSEEMYLGVLSSAPHPEQAEEYISYLLRS